MNAVVHYIKHWDNDTEGSVSYTGIFSLGTAITRTETDLIDEALADGASKNAYPYELFTITKAEIVADVQAYAGHVSSL